MLDGIESGNNALKALSDELNIERVERVMEEAAEMHAWQQEVAELTGNSISEEEIDEDALWQQFNEVGMRSGDEARGVRVTGRQWGIWCRWSKWLGRKRLCRWPRFAVQPTEGVTRGANVLP